MATTRGHFGWYELMTSDVAAAQAFYGAVVGWTAEDVSQPGMPYAVFLQGSHRVAGLMPLPETVRQGGGRPGWLGYVMVDDADAYAERVTAAGGTVHRAPEDIPGVGRFAVVADPGGAVFVLFTPSGAAAPSAPPHQPGSIGWRELMAADHRAAFDFYAGLFGWTEGMAVDMGPMGTYQLFQVDGVDNGGMMTKPASLPAPPFWGFYFTVDSIEAAAERVKQAGGSVVNGPHPVPGGSWILQGLDPQGAHFALTSGSP